MSEPVHAPTPRDPLTASRVFIRVWDPMVRIGHWLLVLCFGAVYFYSDKFPLHVYSAYVIMAYMLFRVVWGFVGPPAARFSAFLFRPSVVIRHGIDSLVGHPRHTISHNPLGGLMIVMMMASMLASGVLGMMLYSAGQEMGPLQNMVPSHWEEEWFGFSLFGHQITLGLKQVHHWLGNVSASLVVAHFLGNLWSTGIHRYRPVVGMITGVKDAEASDPELSRYPRAQEPRLAKSLYDAVGPVVSETILVAVILIAFMWPVLEFLAWVNKFVPSY